MIPSKSSRGETMIEVLVTALILAVGVLGAAGMQLTSFQNLRTSNSTSVAAMMGTDFGERMRANTVGTAANDYNHSTAPATYKDCVSNVCTMAELAAYDIATWTQMLQSNLPSATGSVARLGVTNSFLITVRWDDDLSGSAGTNCPMVGDEDLDCYQLTITL